MTLYLRNQRNHRNQYAHARELRNRLLSACRGVAKWPRPVENFAETGLGGNPSCRQYSPVAATSLFFHQLVSNCISLFFMILVTPMSEIANISDNNEGDEAPPRRGPGRPKGLPKPPGSGRKRGTPNKVTRDIREAASKHGPKALQALVGLLESFDPKVKTAAAREILDRAYGRPVSPTELTGKDGEPLMPAAELSDIDALRRVRWMLNKAKREASAQGEPDDALETLAVRSLPSPQKAPEALLTPEPADAAQAASDYQTEQWRRHAEAEEQRRHRPWSDPDHDRTRPAVRRTP